MKITRNGVEIELTPDEVRDAFVEYQRASTIEDVRRILSDPQYKDARLSDEDVERIAIEIEQNVVNGAAESYWEMAVNVVDGIVDELRNPTVRRFLDGANENSFVVIREGGIVAAIAYLDDEHNVSALPDRLLDKKVVHHTFRHFVGFSDQVYVIDVYA